MISVFDLFKIGIGPSSSHTVGPMVAAKRFRDAVEALPAPAARIAVELYGSLAWTGRGHGTDLAVGLGLLGASPATIDPDSVAGLSADLAATRRIALGEASVRYDPASDLVFNFVDLLPGHSNGMNTAGPEWSAASSRAFGAVGGYGSRAPLRGPGMTRLARSRHTRTGGS